MITRIEIDGFKTFTEFSVDLAPFQVIIGPNGSGKSNLFDALRLLARLADMDLPSAFQDMRGQTHELFTIRPDGQIAEHMTLTVGILVDSTVKDDWGEQVELKYPRLRYQEAQITGDRTERSRHTCHGLMHIYRLRKH